MRALDNWIWMTQWPTNKHRYRYIPAVLIILRFFFAYFLFLQKRQWINGEMKFTLSFDSLSSWDSIYEDDQEKISELPEYIKKLASQGKLNSIIKVHNRELVIWFKAC